MERRGYEFAVMLVTFVCILYFASQICINPTQGHIPHHSREKKAGKVCIYKFNYFIWQNEVFFCQIQSVTRNVVNSFFMKTWICRKNVYVNMMVRISLVINSVLF